MLLAKNLEKELRDHGSRDYPHECCGALLGTDGGGEDRQVRSLFPLINRRDDSPRNRFSITPEDFRAAERAAAERGLDLLGWYHSHPDHPARPSEFDREHAWPWYSYVIVSVDAGVAKDLTSWRLEDDRSKFLAEEVGPERAAARQSGADL
ncbi:MAG TPA: M67 family metallopeptidase [Candidatus Acidoferrales bacterium]|nr:M67 family metallopeptidase [Candidatus Acidoferrales bacterium]